MLQILGRNRIILLAVLAVLNVLSAGVLYQYLMPQRETSDRSLSSTRSQLEAKREEIKKLKEEYALLQNQLRYFKDIQSRGFFNDQNRVEAQESFEKLRAISGVLKAKYNIGAGQLIEDPRAADADYVVLQSPISVERDSIDDVDVYSFLKLIQERFPGKVDIVSMDIIKSHDVSSDLLRSIVDGDPKALVTSKISFEWSTMASRKSLFPESSIEPDTTGDAQ